LRRSAWSVSNKRLVMDRRLLARVMGVGIKTADMLVHEVLSRNMRDPPRQLLPFTRRDRIDHLFGDAKTFTN
jgi:hypothetical protein